MKQFLINLWNAQKNARAAHSYRLMYLEWSEYAEKLEDELHAFRKALPSRDSKGRFKGKGQ